jgi:hypothetical protein
MLAGGVAPPEDMMMNRRVLTIGAALTILVLGVTACSEEQSGTITSQIEDKTFTVQPATAPVRVGFLTGQLTDLKVVERVNKQTGEVVHGPRLQGMLKLRNETANQTARLVSGSLQFLDRDGQPIPLAANREAPRFTFYGYGSDRLDPGMETTHNVDVSFPAAALDGTALADLRVSGIYIPDPYRAESATVPVSVAATP